MHDDQLNFPNYNTLHMPLKCGNKYVLGNRFIGTGYWCGRATLTEFVLHR